jgi:hypothetical protein
VKHVAAFGPHLYVVVDKLSVISGKNYGGFVGRAPVAGGSFEYLATIPENFYGGGIIGGMAVDASLCTTRRTRAA